MRLFLLTLLLGLAALFPMTAQTDMLPQRDDDTTTRRGSGLPLDFDDTLAIDTKRITQDDLHAEAGVYLGGPGETVHVRVGAAVDADHIVVMLRGVRGRVRFHGSLERITVLFNRK